MNKQKATKTDYRNKAVVTRGWREVGNTKERVNCVIKDRNQTFSGQT